MITTKISNKSIRSYKGPLLWPCTVGDVEVTGCTLTACSIGFRHSKDFKRRTIVRNVVMKDCRIESKTLIGPAQIENVQLENILGYEVFVLGALYKHVIMKGKFDAIVIHGLPNLETPREDRVRYWALCDQFYADCDWALDISKAEFASFDIRLRGIPADLVVRDPETQIEVRMEKIVEGRWRSIPLSDIVQAKFRMWENGGGEDLLIVAPKRNKKDFAAVMGDIRLLRDAGIAEPD